MLHGRAGRHPLAAYAAGARVVDSSIYFFNFNLLSDARVFRRGLSVCSRPEVPPRCNTLGYSVIVNLS